MDPGALQRLDRDEVGHVDAERLVLKPELAQLVRDLRAEPVGDPRLDGHRAAHRRDAGAEVLLGQPRREQLVVAGGRAEVPEDRIGAAREQREARVLVARPLADVRARDVADVVRVEQQHRAELRGLERRLRAVEPLLAQAREVDALLPVHRPRRVGRADRPASRAHCVTSCRELAHSRARRRRRGEAGSAPQVQEERHEVVVCVAGLDRRAKVRLQLRRHRELDAGVARRVEDQVDVLLHQRRRERRRVVVAQQRLGLVLDERRAGGRAPHHLEERRARDARGLAEHERLRHQLRERRRS